ncbi:MAG: DEAD/DEAH box helicase [Solirubrobacterales bacterium]
MSKFKDLGLNQAFADALDKVGYTDPTPIQEQAIPELLKGSDVIGQAQTGTGKTAAFGLPMLQSLIAERREVQALVLTPTRELCIQVAQSLRAYGAIAGIDVLATFGGAPIRQQMDRLKAGPQVVVGTVGRVLDLNSRHALMFHDARFVVLDEADEMLDLGFLEDVETILKKTPRGRQTALFSATMPPAIAKLAEVHMHDPVTIKVKAPTLTIDTVEHFQKKTTKSDKIDTIIDVLEAERPTQAIVFARTKIGVDRLARDLDRRKPGLRIRALHGDMSQGSRDGVMIAFKDNRVPVLVATDIAARGLDVQNVTHVINYDLPNSAEIYTHRIGRTGRAGRGGRAITLVEPRDKEDFVAIEKHINVQIPEWDRSTVGKSTVGKSPVKSTSADKPAGRTPRKRVAADSDEAAVAESLVEIDAGAAETPSQDVEPAEVPQATEDLVEIDAGGVNVTETEEPAEAAAVVEEAAVEEAEKQPFTWPGQSPAEPEAAEAAEEPEADEPAEPEAAGEETPAAEAEEIEAEEEAAIEEERELRHPRHVKPNQQELDGDFSLLIVNGGASRGVEPADVIELVTSKSDLTGSDVRRVRVLSRYTLMQVPTDKAAGVVGALDGSSLRGEPVVADAVVRTNGAS